MVRVWAGWWGVSELDGGDDGSYEAGGGGGWRQRQVSRILGLRRSSRKEPIVDLEHLAGSLAHGGWSQRPKAVLMHRPRHLIFGTLAEETIVLCMY